MKQNFSTKFTTVIIFMAATILSCTKSENPVKRPAEGPSYIENGKDLGKSIAVEGDWRGDGKKTTLYWAPVNCGFEEAGDPFDINDHRFGKLYQWGAGDSNIPYKYNGEPIVAREMYYDTPTPDPWYDWSTLCGTDLDKWNNNQGPCPKGWRLPTVREFCVLSAGKNGDYGWVEDYTYGGELNCYRGSEFFGANSDMTPGTGVFLPAAGYIDSDYGEKGFIGWRGYYWTSETTWEGSAKYFYAAEQGLETDGDLERANCYSVRCVKQ